MVDVRCPNCNRLMYRHECSVGVHEIVCPKCNAPWVITYIQGQAQIDYPVTGKMRPSKVK